MSIERGIELLRPHEIENYNKIRIGPETDGGYVMVDDFDGISFAISGGIGHDDLWEQYIVKNTFIPLDAYDVVDNGWTNTPYRLFFTGLHGDPNKNSSTLDEKLQKYKENQVIAKIDIEGDEWNLLQYTSEETLKKIRHMVLELHLNGDINNLINKALPVLEKLYRLFRVVHIHGNNWSNVYEYKGLNIPDVMEVTFANINYYKMKPSHEIFPTNLDNPNNPNKIDIFLGTFTLKG